MPRRGQAGGKLVRGAMGGELVPRGVLVWETRAGRQGRKVGDAGAAGQTEDGNEHCRGVLVLGADGSGVTAPLVWTAQNQLQIHDFCSGETKKYTRMVTAMLILHESWQNTWLYHPGHREFGFAVASFCCSIGLHPSVILGCIYTAEFLTCARNVYSAMDLIVRFCVWL